MRPSGMKGKLDPQKIRIHFGPFEDPVDIVSFHDIKIPEDASNPFELVLKLPAGSLRAILCDGLTGMALGDDLVGMRCGLVPSSNPSITTMVSGSFGSKDSALNLSGIPGGEYILSVILPGYRQYLSLPFELQDGQSLDMDRIMLDPCGVIDLEVTDQAGKHIPYSASFQGEEMGSTSGSVTYLSENKKRYWNLPLGSVTIKVSVRGFKSKEIPLVLEPAQPNQVSVILEPEE